MKKLTEKSSICKVDDFFRAAPSSVAAIRLNHSASPVQEVSPMFCSVIKRFYLLTFLSLFFRFFVVVN